jgi:hypothetical protein
MKLHFLPNPEIQHLRMRPHLAQKSQPRYDFVIQLHQFILGECVDIDAAHFLGVVEASLSRHLLSLPQFATRGTTLVPSQN